MNKSCIGSSAVLLVFAAICSAQDYLDRAVERARKAFDVPGIAVAVVKDGAVVVSKGYGLRKLGDPAPVTPQSLFRIASNTKAFTAAALAMLVDERRIGWDDAVTQHMPAFQMYDPYVTRELTVRDLLVHRSGLGLGEGDLMFFPPTDLSRDEIVRRLRFLKPATSFRSHYAYDNLLYLVAGQLIPAVTGKSWDDFVKERIFTPLGMTRTYTLTDALKTGRDVALPHVVEDGNLVTVPHEDVDNNAPAGSIISCVADLAKWVTVQLNGGALNGNKRLFTAAQGQEMWSAQTIMPIGNPDKSVPAALAPALAIMQPNFSAYGLGWSLRDYRGRKMVGHTGDLSGYVSRVAMIPDLKLGIVVLTNQEAAGAHTAIAYTVMDHYLDAPETDWVSIFAAQAKKVEADAEAAVRKAAGSRKTDTHPSLPIAAYAGRYRDDWYGDIRIEEQQGKLAIYFTHTAALAGGLEHWQYDTFIARWKNRTLGADAYVTFSLKADGAIAEMKMAPVSPATDFSFDFQDLLFRPVAIDVKPM